METKQAGRPAPKPTNTPWQRLIVSLHRAAYAAPDGLTHLPYCRAERAYLLSAVLAAMSAAEEATTELALRNAQLEAVEARLQFLERAQEGAA